MKVEVVLLMSCTIVAGMSVGNQYTHSVTLDPEEKFNISWTFEDLTPNSYITFTITCQTTGWVGIGLSPNGAMTGSDIMVVWVADDGEPYLLDMHATSNGPPILDESQDTTLISSSESNGVTTITFKRKLDTCDSDGDSIVTTSTTRMIYAYKDTDPVSKDTFGSSDYHESNRGVRSLYLLEEESGDKSQSIPSNAQSFDIKIRNYSMPAVDTVYYCSFHEAPKLDTPHHVIAVEPLIDEGNLALVHHIILYGCWGLTEEHIRRNNVTEGICETDEMPEFAENCATLMHGWAVGGETFYYPDEAGYPIGAGTGAAPDYYQMEMHYDNPQLLTTYVDSSGLRLIYTPTIRANEAGSIGMGMVGGIFVPPRTDKFRTISFCDGSCTNQWIPDEGIELYGYLLHTHLLGTAIQVDWFREGEHVGVLAYDDAYDFNYQNTRHFKDNKKIMPGDSMKVTCTYSSSRETVTYGGLRTSEEMCFAYLFYYPRQTVGGCSSIPRMFYDPTDPVYSSLSVNASADGHRYANYYVLDEVSEWTDGAVGYLQKAYDESHHYSSCYNETYSPYPSSSQEIEPTSFVAERQIAEKVCVKTGTSSAPIGAVHSIPGFLLALLTLAL